MIAIGLFEAKTKLSEICERVATKGITVVVTRRGKPWVRIEAIKANNAGRESVWDRRADYEKKHGAFTEEFDLPAREKQLWRNPLND